MSAAEESATAIAQSSAPIEVDESDESYSDYSSTIGTNATTSISSSVKNFVYENGRRYHSYEEGKYPMPNDETEQDRLDLHHHHHLLLLGGRLYIAPITTPQRVLDCGTGTGIWAIDFADVHPSAQVIGVDLSPIQPTWVPPNVKFEVDDVFREWTWPVDHFDFVHSRLISNVADWPGYVGNMYKHTAPNGWIEISEYEPFLSSDDGTYTPDTGIYKYFTTFIEAGKRAGLNFIDSVELKKVVEDAGFVDVEAIPFKQPWGPWAKNKGLKRIGQIMVLNCETGLEAYALALFTRVMGMTDEEARELCAMGLRDVANPKKVHAYNNLWHVIGRKPTKEELEK